MTTVAQRPDAIAALRAYLTGVGEIRDEIGTRCYGGELSPAEARTMPRAAILLRAAGGMSAFATGSLKVSPMRVDVFCYGATPYDADALWRKVHPALKHMAAHNYDGCRLLWAKQEGGPLPLRDPETDWPSTFTTWQVCSVDEPAT